MDPDNERYANEIEKAIYNIGLANQDSVAGLRYHTILEGKKEKGTHMNTCCEAQGTRLLGSLPEHIYSIAPDGLYVHLFEPSTIRWNQGGQPMEFIMRTRFPFERDVRCTVKTSASSQAIIRIRVPSWANGEIRISVNAEPSSVGKPGTYLSIDRQWADGDTIEFTLPISLQVRRYNGADQIPGKTRFSVEYGPILLAAVGSSRVDLAIDEGRDAEHLANHIEQVTGAPLHFTVRGNPGQRFIPYWQVSEEEFTCYPAVITTV